MITDYVMSTIQYIEQNLQVEAVGAIVIIALILLFIISFIFLVFRRSRLWYWKINEQLAVLEKIDSSLEGIRRSFPGIQRENEEKEIHNAELEETVTSAESSNEPKACKEEGREQPLKASTEEAVDKGHTDAVLPKFNIGKTGTIYTEDLLRKQIQY